MTAKSNIIQQNCAAAHCQIQQNPTLDYLLIGKMVNQTTSNKRNHDMAGLRLNNTVVYYSVAILILNNTFLCNTFSVNYADVSKYGASLME